jgi:hypothetical protein
VRDLMVELSCMKERRRISVKINAVRGATNPYLD